MDVADVAQCCDCYESVEFALLTHELLMSYSIRTLSSIEDYRQAEAIQRDVWVEYVPLTMLMAAQKNGGLAAGAFEPSGAMLGFVYGFVGLTHEGRFKHCSHMLAVGPSLRRQGLGATIKWFQRDFVIDQGKMALVTLTFDPLEGVNRS